MDFGPIPSLGQSTTPPTLATERQGIELNLAALEGKNRVDSAVFEASTGPEDDQVGFLFRGSNYTFHLNESGGVLRADAGSSNGAVVAMNFISANANPLIAGIAALPGETATGLNGVELAYAQVRYDEIYSGIDLIYYGRGGELEYDWIVDPGADPDTIRMSFSGAVGIEIEADGDLNLHTTAGDLVQSAPVLYQEIGGQRQAVDGRFELRGGGPDGFEVGFEVGAYDPSLPLVIDPIIGYSTYLGGSRNEVISFSAIDAAGNTYVLGTTSSLDLSPDVVPETGNSNAFWAKYDAQGREQYRHVIASASEPGQYSDTSGSGLALGADGTPYVLVVSHEFTFDVNGGGPTSTSDMQLHLLALAPDGLPVSDMVLLKSDTVFSPDHQVYAVGAPGMIAGPDGALYVAALQLRATPGGGAVEDDFIIKVKPDAGIVFKQPLFQAPEGLRVDAQQNIYLAFSTNRSDLPVSDNAIRSKPAGSTDTDIYLQALDPTATGLLWATYLGGSANEYVGGMTMNPAQPGVLYLAGNTSSADFPMAVSTTGVKTGFQTTLHPLFAGRTQGLTDGFVAVVDLPKMKLLASTYLGGGGDDGLSGIALDAVGNVYVSGQSNSPDFPVANPLYGTYSAGESIRSYAYTYDFVVAKLNATLSTLQFSTYLGGTGHDSAQASNAGRSNGGPDVRVDAAGTVHVTGTTSSEDFPVLNAQQPDFAGGIRYIGGTYNITREPSDGVVLTLLQRGALVGLGGRATVGREILPIVATFANPRLNSSPADFAVTIDWGDGTESPGLVERSGGAIPVYLVYGLHTYDEPGAYPVLVTVRDRVNDILSPLTNLNLTHREGSQIAPAMAQDPTFLRRLVSVATTEPPLLGGAGPGIILAISTNGGENWAPRLLADGHDTQPAAKGSPDVLFDTFGNLYIAYLSDAGKVVLLTSKDGGMSFGDVPLKEFSLTSLSPELSRPRLAWNAARNEVWLSVMDSASGELMAAASKVSGLGQIDFFTTRTTNVGEGAGDVDIATGPDGGVAIVWEQQRDDGTGMRLKMVYDEDGLGSRLPAPVLELLTANRVGDVTVPALPDLPLSLSPVLAWDNSSGPDRGRLYVAYQDLALNGDTAVDGDLDAYLIWSDDGATWADPVRIAGAAAGQQLLPTVAVDQSSGVLAAAWYDTQIGPDAVKVFFTVATSADGGATFSTPRQVAKESSDLPLGRAKGPGPGPRMVFANQALHAVWADSSSLRLENNSDGDYEIATQTLGIIDVTPARVQIRPNPIAAVKGADFNGTVATFTIEDDSREPDDFSASIEWGDGGKSAGAVSQPGGAGTPFMVTGNHVYAAVGAYPIWVTVTDAMSGLETGAVSNVTTLQGSQTETSIAIDSHDPNRVFAASNDNSGRSASGMVVAASADGGVTWASDFLGDGSDGFPPSQGDPKVAYDPFGNLYVTYLTKTSVRGVAVLLSENNGLDFRLLTVLQDPLDSADQPSITVGPGRDGLGATVWLTWERGDEPFQIIMAAGAEVTGLGAVSAFQQRFVAPLHGDGQFRNFGDIAIGPKGEVVLSYARGIAGAPLEGPSQIVTQTDSDGLGPLPFGPEVLVTDTKIGAHSPIAAQARRTIDSEGNLAWDRSDGAHAGRLHLIYTDAKEAIGPNGLFADTDVLTRYSDDQGQTWSEPIDVAGYDTGSAFFPSIAIDQSSGNLGISWYDSVGPNAAQTRYTATISDDGGVTWNRMAYAVAPGPSDASAATLDPRGFDNQYGDYTGLDFVSGILQPIWADNSLELEGNPDPRRFEAASARIAVATVFGLPLVMQGADLKGTAGTPVNAVLATFTDPEGARAPSSYKATIDWGDGTQPSPSVGVVSKNEDGSFSVRAEHEYKAAGSFTAKVVVNGPSTRGEAHVKAEIAKAPKTVTFADDGRLRVVREVEFSKVLAVLNDGNHNSKAADFDVSITWGDGSFSDGVVALTSAGAAGGANVFSITGKHNYISEQTYAVQVSVRVKADGEKLTTSGALVNGDPPMTLDTTNDIIDALAGVTVGDRLLAVFTVEGDIQTGIGEYIATINWGDGTVDANVHPFVNRTDGITVVGRHTYADAGQYYASVTVVDDSGNVATAPLVNTVEPDVTSLINALGSGLVYDPAQDRFIGDLTITNVSGSDIDGPLYVLIKGLPDGVTLDSTDQQSGAGDPLFKVEQSRLAAGASLVPIALEFSNPGKVPIAYTVQVFDGIRMQAPAGAPLVFEPNRGQANAAASFIARGQGYAIGLSATGASLLLGGSASQAGAAALMELVGANPSAVGTALEAQAGVSNYLRDDQAISGVAHFARVRYASVYAGVDLEYYGRDGVLEYDWIVHPGADASAIAIRFAGIDGMRADSAGNLRLHINGGELVQRAPVAYQLIGGVRHDVSASFDPRADGTIGLTIGAYDASVALVIDPVLVYSTYLGGSSYEDAVAVAVDAHGNTYLTGTTTSSDFFTVRAFDPELNDPATVPFYYRPDTYVTKLDANGVPVYSTYLGGDANKSVFGYGTSGLAIAVGADGRVWTTGLTDSATFPQTDAEPAGGLPQLPPDPQGIPGIRPYLTQLAADGSAVLYSTLFSFGSTLRDLALDGRGGLYATGENIGRGVFALKLDTTRHEIDYVTYLGGGNFSFGIAADASGQAYLTGWTTQRDFPTVNALYPNPLTPLVADYRYQQSDGFLAKLASNGDVLFSTYYGGSGGVTPYDIAVDLAGSIVVVGETGSTDLPVPGAVQTTPGGGRDGFLLKFANDGSRVLYGTYIGGSEYDRIKGVAVDAAGRAYVGGSTGSDDLPTWQAFQPAYSGGANNPPYYQESEGFAGALTSDGSAFGYLTYLGGSRFDEVIGVAADAAGNASFVGRTNSTDFATRQAAQTHLLGTDAFVTRILAQDDGTIALRNVPVRALAGTEFSGLVAAFTSNGTETAAQFSASIDWGDGAISAGVISGNFRDGFRVTGTHLYASEGTRDLQVTLLDSNSRPVRSTSTSAGVSAAGGVARYRVSVDTPTLSGGAGLLSLEFNPGALPGGLDAQALIRNLRVTGGTLGALSLEGGASGDAASEAVLTPTAVLNRLLNALAFGSRIEFDLEFSGPALVHPAGGSFADVFALRLLAADGRTPLLASDATGSLLRIDVLPNGTTRARPADAAVYAASLGQAAVFRPSTRLNLTLLPFSIQEGQPYAGQVGTFTSSDLTQTATQFTALIDWGDGSVPTAGTVSGMAGRFTLAGNHTYAATGNYRLAVTLSDADASAVFERSPPAGVGALEASPAVLVTGSQLRPPLIADLNGDGLLDVVSSDWLTSSRMVARLGQGDFTFAAAIDLPSSAKTSSWYAAGDFNGDGKTDLVTAGETSGARSVRVLLGDGSGHFSDGPAATVIAPAAASITTIDLDEDGRLDVIIGSGFSSGANLPGQLLVLRGRGDGSFDAPVARSVGAGNMTTVAADMNRDGHVDLVVGGTFGSSLQVLLGDGTGALTPLPNLPVSALGVFSVVDINADAVPDILAADGDLAVFIGQGDGTFSATRQSLGRPLGSVAVAVDLDADGRAELVYAEAGGTGGTALNVLRAGADGRFVVFDSVAVPNGVTLLSAADFNGDGKLDVAMDVGTEVRLVTGRGDATLIAPSTVLAPDLARAVIAVDSNGDGRIDLVSAGEGGVSVQLNQGGGFDDPARISAGGTVFNTVLLGDIDGDGRDDIVAGSATGISVLLRRADGSYAQPVSIGIGRVTDLALGDINGDGALDVAASIPGNGLVSGVSGVAILLNNGSGGLAFSEMVGARTGLGNGSGPGTLLLRDLNDDGKADLVARLDGDYNGTTFVNGGLGISLRTGSSFGTQSIVPAGTDYARARNGIAAGDVDGDGKVDLVTVASGFSFVANVPLAQNGLFVLLGNGDGSFHAGQVTLTDSLPVTTQLGSLALADLNRDGRLDIVATRHTNFNTDSPDDTVVLLGAGDGTFGSAVAYDGAGQAWQLQVGDIDGDGVPDLVINEFSVDPAKSGVNVLLGVGDGSFGRRTTYYAGETPAFALGDIDGDGDLDVLTTVDLLVNGAHRGELAVLRGRGDGTLTAPVFSLVGHTPVSLTAVDFNGDAYPDLAFLSNLGKVGLLIGRGDGSFDLRTPAVIGSSGGAGIALQLSDIDGDGLRELVVGFGTLISVPLDAAGNAGTPVTRAAALGFNSLTAFGDFDSDGVLDAMDVHREFGNNHGLAVVRRGLGNGSFAAGPSVDIGANTKAVMAGDLNNDGHLDLVFSNEGDSDSNLNYSGSLSVMLGNGDGTFQTPFNATQSMPFGALALTDLDGDGYLDIAAVKGAFTRSERGLAVLLNHQDGSFTPATVYDTGTATSVALGVLLGADLAGDGAPELIFAEGNRDGLLRILQNRPARAGITVSNAPLAVTGNTLNPVAGVVFTAVIGTLRDDNPLATAADHSASIDWGDGSSSAATIAADGQGGFSLTGSHLYATAGVRGIGIAAADRAGGNASGAGRANVGVSDLTLTADGLAVEAMAQTAFEGPVARFSDADPNGSASDFRARIDWGDGSEAAGLVVAAAGNGFEVRGQHVYERIGAYTLRVAITDIGGSTTSASARAAVGRPPNHAPVALDDHVVTLEDTPVAFDVRRNDSDTDRDLLRVVLLAGPSHGSLEQLVDGSFIYRPDFNQVEGDSFTYRVEDAVGAMSQARVDIALTPLNDAPLLAPIAEQQLAAGQTLSVQAQATDPDIGDPLSFVLDQAPAGATIDASGRILWGASDTGGTASFVVRVTDQAGAAATRAFEAVALAAVNSPPVAVADTAATNEDTPVVVNMLANDSDPEGNPLTAILVDAPAHGDVAKNADGSFTYTPAAHYQGPDSFTYKANDGSLDSNLASVTLTVNPVNDKPTATAITTQNVDEGQTLSLSVVGHDEDGDALSYSLLPGSVGSIDAATGVYSFAALDGNASYTASVRVSDGRGPDSAYDLSFGINVHNIAPSLAISGAASGSEGQAYSLSLAHSDPGVDTLSGWTIDWGDATVSGAAGDASTASHTYAAPGNFHISASASDEDGSWVANSISVAIAPMSFRVTAFTLAENGFHLDFNKAFQLGTLNLYTAAGNPIMGTADLVLTRLGAAGPIRGSLVPDDDLYGATFIKTNGVFDAGAYTLTLASRADAWKDTAGRLLDGNGDGTAGDNYTATFTVAASSSAILSLGEVLAGPGQSLTGYAPLNQIPLDGLPITLSNATGVTHLSFDLAYAPSLLNISSVGFAAGVTGSYNLTTPGVISISLTTPALGAGAVDLVRLYGSVPANASTLGNYGAKQVLDLYNVTSTRVLRVDDGLMVNAYPGDASGNADYDTLDTTAMLRLITAVDTGFAAWPLVDSSIIGDINRDKSFSSMDRLLLDSEINWLVTGNATKNRKEIVTLPSGIGPITFTGADPLVDLPRDLTATAGSLATVPVRLDIADDLEQVQLQLAWDASQLELVEVRRGTLTGGFGNYVENRQAGSLYVDMSSLTRLVGGQGTLLELVFRVSATASGAVDVDLRWAQLNQSRLTLNPAPQLGADPTDGVIRVNPPAPPTTTSVTNPQTVGALSSASPVIDFGGRYDGFEFKASGDKGWLGNWLTEGKSKKPNLEALRIQPKVAPNPRHYVAGTTWK